MYCPVRYVEELAKPRSITFGIFDNNWRLPASEPIAATTISPIYIIVVIWNFMEKIILGKPFQKFY